MNDNEIYLKIFDHFPNPIWRAGLDTKCNFFNKAWLDFTGRTMEQEMGNGWAEGVYKEDFDNCLKTYLEAFKKQESFQMEYRLKHRDGTYHWILDCGSPFYDNENNFLGYIGSCYDINENRGYKELFSNMSSGFAYHKVITDNNGKVVNYRFIDINPIFEKIVNLDRAKIVGKNVTEVFPGIEKDPANWIEKYGKLAMDGGEIKFESYSEVLGKWFNVSAYSPEKGYFVTIFDDITERKKSEDELARKLAQVEKMNKLMVDRELKMVELKKEIESLRTSK